MDRDELWEHVVSGLSYKLIEYVYSLASSAISLWNRLLNSKGHLWVMAGLWCAAKRSAKCAAVPHLEHQVMWWIRQTIKSRPDQHVTEIWPAGPRTFWFLKRATSFWALLLKSISSQAHLLNEDWCVNYKGNIAQRIIYMAKIVLLFYYYSLSFVTIDHCYFICDFMFDDSSAAVAKQQGFKQLNINQL